MRERLDADLARLSLPGVWGNLGIVVVILLSTSLYRDAPLFSTIVAIVCILHCVLRGALILCKKSLYPCSPALWRSTLHWCLLSAAGMWGAVSAFAIFDYGYDHRNTLMMLCCVIAMAAGGINMLLANRVMATWYLVLCFGPSAAVNLVHASPIAYVFLVTILMLFFYFWQQSRSLHYEYWRGLSDDWNLRLKSRELQALAHHDSLTGLPNRLFLKERATELIDSPQSGTLGLALFYVDLDRFKQVNDNYSHRVGDLYLSAVAARIACAIYERETLARIGGDEFLLLLENVPDAAAAAIRAQTIFDQFKTPAIVEGHELPISASIGVSLYPDQGDDLETLQKNADYAMYRAKNLGRNQFQIFSPELSEKNRRAKIIEKELFRALGGTGLTVQYQPQFNLNRELVGLEALCRFHSPELGSIAPFEFIPVAEESGLIVPIGRWVLQEVCRQMGDWKSSGLALVRVAVNVSVAQLTREDFVDEVAQILQQSALDPRLLELELTESLLMLNLAAVAQHMTDLRKLGVRFSIDDFGAGYSSLGYLHKLPIDLVKIDRCFVSDLHAVSSSQPVIESIFALARNLRLGVIAEGVETVEQYSTLRNLGCKLFQGYLFAKPLHPDRVVSLLAARQASAAMLPLAPPALKRDAFLPIREPSPQERDESTADLVRLAGSL